MSLNGPKMAPHFDPGLQGPNWQKSDFELFGGSKWLACMECSEKDVLRPFNAIIGIEMQRESRGCQDYWIHFSSWPSLSGHLNNLCINSLQKGCPHSRVLLVVLSQDILSQHLMSTRSQILAISGTFWLLFGCFVHFWGILVLFWRSWVKICD